MSAIAHPMNDLRWWSLTDGGMLARVVVILCSCSILFIGSYEGVPLLVGAGAAGLCMISRHVEQVMRRAGDSRLRQLAMRLLAGCGPYSLTGQTQSGTATKSRPSPGRSRRDPERFENGGEPPKVTQQRKVEPPIESTEGLVESMLSTKRYALLLRAETTAHLDEGQYARVIAALDEQMSLVPEGNVLIGMAAERSTLGQATIDSHTSSLGKGDIASVNACYLNRWTVTNAEFQQFVDVGGYEQLEFWPEESLPAIFDFVDTTGQSAPRFWADGRFAEGEEQLPVVGVSWYEASAYARWVGRRLPADAEWTKACAWPVESTPGRIAQRRYPWGESFDSQRANLWSSGHGRTTDVQTYLNGASVGGLEQMIGNVWEWTADSLDEATPDNVSFPTALRSIRGGAFNTYFENQATCHFQSGEHPLARRANIGVRLALDMQGLASLSNVTASAH